VIANVKPVVSSSLGVSRVFFDFGLSWGREPSGTFPAENGIVRILKLTFEAFNSH